MKLSVFMILQVLWNSEWSSAKPFEQGSVTETGEVTPYPDTQKRFVNINNVSPEVSNILKEHNMSLDQINLQKEKLLRENRTMNRNFYEMIPSTTYPTLAATKEREELMRINSIRDSLEKTLRENEDGDQNPNAEFDYTLAAVCEIPPHIKLSDWFGQKSWNIFFKPNYRQYNIKSVILRLFKVSTQASKTSKECDPDVGDFYKLVVSVYSRKRKEMKKKTIYVEMIASNFNGWVEINALSTLNFWDLPRNNFGMAIDIYDQDDNQLDAKEHFHLQNCEAGPQIPWGAFELLAKSYRTDVSQDVVALYRDLYTGPRLDLTSTTTAKYSVRSSENQQSQPEQQKISRHLRHTHHRRHHHLPRSSVEESSENSSFESNLQQVNAKWQDHSHRSNSKVEET